MDERRIIWAPWRIKYIRESTGGTSKEGCIFCILPSENRDEENLILYRGKYAFIILNRFPYNTGHLMIVPYRHVSSLEGLEYCELQEISILVKHTLKALRKAMKPEGFNVGVNIGRAAGAGIEGHVHVHIVPRWNGDANFMTVTGGVRVIPQSLHDTYREVKPFIENELQSVDYRGC